jgi:putative FmdB family regulatory protein
MPLYEYICKNCGHHFDTLRSFKEADKPIRCKNCLSEQTSRAISIFFAQSDGRSITQSSAGCGGCSGGSCGSCGHNH